VSRRTALTTAIGVPIGERLARVASSRDSGAAHCADPTATAFAERRSVLIELYQLAIEERTNHRRRRRPESTRAGAELTKLAGGEPDRQGRA
jgi:hypothetical protein